MKSFRQVEALTCAEVQSIWSGSNGVAGSYL